MHTIFWLQNLKGSDHLEDLGVDGNKIFECTHPTSCPVGTRGSFPGGKVGGA